ncbi:MAG TPA: hypothetical protein VFR33_16135 [Candidatus Dormibacteraeota bacterium]|nr:hypothetical protein [Candidatus Dormibacteraeota bacterium]
MPYIRLPQSGRPWFIAIAGAIVGALFTYAGPQVVNAMDRPSCAETVMQAVSTETTVNGTYGCFDRGLQLGLLTIGVNSDSSFADRIGQSGEYHFLRKTADGGYVYEYDRATTPHDRFQGMFSALSLPQTRIDFRHGNFLAAWNEPHNLRKAWAEISGQTQNTESRLFTFYVGPDGRITAIK